MAKGKVPPRGAGLNRSRIDLREYDRVDRVDDPHGTFKVSLNHVGSGNLNPTVFQLNVHILAVDRCRSLTTSSAKTLAGTT